MWNLLLKVAFRNLRANKGFSLLNVLGLTLGLTACLLIGFYVRDEKQFDGFVPEGERIYRAVYHINNNAGTTLSATTPPNFAEELQQNFGEVDKATRVLQIKSKVLFEGAGKQFYEQGGILTDPSFLSIFPLEMADQAAASNAVLEQPSSVLISEELATKLFGVEKAIGQTLLIGKDSGVVSGVFQKNSKFHLDLNYILPLSSAELSDERLSDWGWYGFYTYFRLKKGVTAEGVAFKFQQLIDPFVNKEGGSKFKAVFQPLGDIHLRASDYSYDMAQKGNIRYVNALIVIAGFILLIGCFNFVNLATAHSLHRAKEVGIRKTVGGSRLQLIGHFLAESFLLTLISFLLANSFTYLLLPYLNAFTGKAIHFDLFQDATLFLGMLLLFFLVGLLAGFYPALVLSRFQPTKVLKNVHGASEPGQRNFVRPILITVQFALSILLIIGSLVVIRQVDYLHRKDLGFDKEQILLFSLRGNQMKKQYKSFKNDLLQSPQVTAVSVGYGFPGDQWGDGEVRVTTLSSPKKVNTLMVDPDYLRTLGIQLIAGRNFSEERKSDETAYIINETAVKELGFKTPQAALGQSIQWPTWANPDSLKKGEVIGVTKDFHYQRLHDRVEPAILQIYPDAYGKVAVKIRTDHLEAALAHIHQIWNRYSPDYPIEYAFLNEQFETMYKLEDKLRSLLLLFTLVTVFVSCLGLFGLAALTAERRRKELGIRKVLGASVQNLLLILSREFVLLTLVSFLLAAPLAWYFAKQWLSNFAYRISLNGGILLTAAAAAVFVVVLTISSQALRAALSNPIKNLREE